MLRIGRIDYANCTPLFMQLEGQLPADSVEIVHGVPAELNACLASGEIDLCISSSIEFVKHPGKYCIVPEHCIGSDGAVKSVLLFASCPVDQLAGEDILVTSESATSVVLLQILLARRWGVRSCRVVPTSLPWHAALGRSKALLLIGDSALKASYAGLGEYCYDLGDEWKQLTGLPFVFALWLVNRSSISGKEAALGVFAALLGNARDNLAANADRLAEKAVEKSWMEQQQLVDYWCHAITYRLDAAHIAGLKLFYEFAVAEGIITAVPDLEFLPV